MSSMASACTHELGLTDGLLGIFLRVLCMHDAQVAPLFDDDYLDGLDPNIIGQPHLSAKKAYDMWAKAKADWNPRHENFNQSGSHAAFESFCKGSKDTFIVEEMVEKFPMLEKVRNSALPSQVQRQFDGTADNAGGTAAGNAATREAAKSTAAEAYESTRKGKKQRVKAERQKATSQVMSQGLSSAISALLPVLQTKQPQSQAGAQSESRKKRDEAESLSAALALDSQVFDQHTEFSQKLVAERQKAAKGEEGTAKRVKFLENTLERLEAHMNKQGGGEADAMIFATLCTWACAWNSHAK